MVVELKYDTPLADPKHDNLGRKDFSQMLAKSIIGLDANEGFVYSIYGPWGSGKSTVINFVEHYLREHNKKADNKIVVFKFNPWMFSGSENLTHIFLDQLRLRLGMKDAGKGLKEISKKLGIIEGALSFSDIALSAARRRLRSSSLRKRTRPRDSGSFAILPIGCSCSHSHSLTATLNAWLRAVI